MFSLPILKGKIMKWILDLLEFDLTYQLAKAIKGQVMANLVTQHCGPEVTIVEPIPWTMFFDGSSCGVGARIGSVLISLLGHIMNFASRLRRLQQTIRLSIRQY
jgi:hypothetical protein